MDVNVQKQCVKVFTAEGVINMQPLLVLTQDLSGVAQQDTLVQGIGDIRDDISTLAKQGTNPDANLSSTQTAAQGAALNSQIARGYIGTPQSGQADTLFGAIANISIDTSTIAKQGTDPSVNITDMDGKLGDVEDALEYIEGGGLPDIAAIAKQGPNASATLTATQAAVVDGNDTAISVAKEIRSEVGTGSDTAGETGTLFAVLKWVKDKVKSIFNLIGSPASGQPSTLFAAIAAGGGGGGEVITYPTVQMTATTASIDANKVYIWGEVTSLDITLNAGEAGVANVYPPWCRSL